MSLFLHIGNFLKLIRWFHGLLALFPFITLYIIIESSEKYTQVEVSGFDFTLICICVQLLMAIGFIWNDWQDMRIDKINKPNTHIIGRTISLRTAKISFGIITLLIFGLSLYISVNVFREWIWISPAVYALAYSLYLKRSPLFGNIAIALMGAFVPLVLLFFARDAVRMLVNTRAEELIYIYAFLLFAIIVPRELSLDISDVEGDRADGCKTLPVLIGIKKSRMVVVAMIAAIVLCTLPLAYHFRHFAIILTLVDLLLIGYLLKFRNAHSRIELIRAGRFLWLVLIVGIIGSTIASLI
jgi:4-hydroxybenzoate polyprenyltransferase